MFIPPASFLHFSPPILILNIISTSHRFESEKERQWEVVLTWPSMCEGEIFVFEWRPVNRLPSRAVVVCEISAWTRRQTLISNSLSHTCTTRFIHCICMCACTSACTYTEMDSKDRYKTWSFSWFETWQKIPGTFTLLLLLLDTRGAQFYSWMSGAKPCMSHAVINEHEGGRILL